MSMSKFKSLTFPTPKSLSEWLKPRMVATDFATWGVKTGTKKVDNLWMELSKGESVLEDSSTPPRRTVSCCVVRILLDGRTDSGEILLESHEELSDGSLRERGRPLNEKMKGGEGGVGFYISVGVDVSDVMRLVPGSSGMRVSEKKDSFSYPGQPSRYVLHSVDAYVDGLPDGDLFTVEEEYADCADTPTYVATVKKHFWK